MPVYVDKAQHHFGRMIMCHMWADTLDELHAMADRIGIRRKWFQAKPHFPHYDIAKSKRAQAVAFGAIETDKYGPAEYSARLKGNAAMLETIAELRAKGFGGAA